MKVEIHELDDFAKSFWQMFTNKKIFAFHGCMGAGKTTTITALCKALGVTDVIGSPTFSIINEYAFIENGLSHQLFHIDLYRLKNIEEAVNTGVEDCIYSGALCLIEWAEKAPDLFNEHTIHVIVQPVNEHVRKINILTAAEFLRRD